MTTAPRPDSIRHLDHALWYAKEMSWAVFPVHVPLFDHETGYTCSCEFYRHSEKCKTTHPHIYMQPEEHCAQPGKCPAVKWAAKATTDAAQIRQWWGRPWRMVDDRTGKAYYFEMNIGRDNGKSAVLTLDADEYKDTYGGAGLLSRDDQETVTAITGGGGTHLDYIMPEGKTYGNQTGDLPPGIDIRGVGGYTVLTPSLHKSGNRYQYEGAYGPDEIDLLPMPQWLCEALESAYSQRSGASGQGVGPSDVEAVQRSTEVVEALIAHAELTHGGAQSWNGDGRKYVLHDCPYSDDHRDGSFIVIHQDGTIGAGCHHSRCQHRIKESGGSGWRLLKEIANFQPDGGAWVVDPEEVRAEVAALRAWALGVNFAEIVPAELITGNYYRTDSVDHKVYDAVLDLAAIHGTRRVYVSYSALAMRAGIGSHKTAQRALQRLTNVLTLHEDVEEIRGKDGKPKTKVARLMVEIMSRADDQRSSTTDKEILVGHQRATYSERKADDPFLTGVSKTAKRLGNEESGLGETILRIVDALERDGDMTRAELVESTGKTKSAVARATLRAERLGLLSAYQDNKKAPKVYSLNPDWADSVETLRPHLKTHKLGLEREKRNLDALIAYCKKKKLDKRQAKAEKRLREILPALYDDVMPKTDSTPFMQQSAVADILDKMMGDAWLDRWMDAPNASNARFDYAPIMQQQRADRWFSDTEILTELIQPGRILWRDELAKARTAAGRLGVNYADYVDTVPLEMAAA